METGLLPRGLQIIPKQRLFILINPNLSGFKYI